MEINLTKVFEGDEKENARLKIALVERAINCQPLKVYWDEAGFVFEPECKQPKRKENNDWRNKGKRGFSGYQSSQFD